MSDWNEIAEVGLPNDTRIPNDFWIVVQGRDDLRIVRRCLFFYDQGVFGKDSFSFFLPEAVTHWMAIPRLQEPSLPEQEQLK